MQTVTCDVRLGGDVGSVVRKEGISVPEVLVLRAIHGNDAIVNITATEGRNVSQKAEFDRLAQKYRVRTSDDKALVPSLFPGAIPQLPTRLAEIGIDVECLSEQEVEMQPKRSRKAKAATVEQTEADAGNEAPPQE